MLKIFKKSLSALVAVAMAVTCLSAATLPTLFASADDVNIALESGVVAIADSVNSSYGGVASNVNDGSNTTRWQSNAKGSSEADMGWIGYNFGKTANFSKVVVYWETARGTVDGVKFYVSNNGTNWTPITATPTSESETNIKNDQGGDMYSYEYTFEEQTAMFLKMEIFKMHNGKEFPSIWELEVYGNFEVDDLTAGLAALQIAIDKADALEETDYTPATWANLQDALADAQEALTSDDAAVVNAATDAVLAAIDELEFGGAYLLAEAVAAADEVVRYRYNAASLAALDAELAKVETTDDPAALADAIYEAIDNLVKENLALNKDSIVDSEDEVWGNKQVGLNDGNMDTRWQSNVGVNPSTGVVNWAVIDFGEAVTFDNLDLYYETSRPSQAGTTVQYSQDGIVWNEIESFVFAGDINASIRGNNTFFQNISFDAVKARYVRVWYTQGHQYDHMSIWEFEVYNSANAELNAATEVADFEVRGAQTRVNAEDATKSDLRFIVNFSANLYAELEAGNITDIGVVLEKMADGTTKTVSTKYLRNIELEKNGKYTYTVTILGIADPNSLWGCTAYYTTAEGTTETAQIVRSVNG